MDAMFLLITLPALGIVSSALCYLIAEKKKLNPMLWLLLGFMFGPIAAGIAFLMNDQQQRT